MIKLASNEQYAFLAAPPTHALLIHLRHAAIPENVPLSATMRVMLPHRSMLDVVYALGTLDSGGAFVPNPYLDPVHTLIDLADYEKLDPGPEAHEPVRAWHAHAMQKHAAAKHLLGADVAPTPGAPHTPSAVPGKPAGEYRRCDLDAIVAHFEPRLAGTVL